MIRPGVFSSLSECLTASSERGNHIVASHGLFPAPVSLLPYMPFHSATVSANQGLDGPRSMSTRTGICLSHLT